MTVTKGNVKNSILIGFILAFTSCAKIQINSPSSRYITPEAQGKLFSGSVRLEQQAGIEGTVDFSNDETDNPLEQRNNVTPLASSIELGLIENVDFLIKGNYGAPEVYTFKFQVLGSPATNASAGNKSLAVTVGYGTRRDNQSESDTTLFDDINDNMTADLDQSIMEASVIYGYRPTEDTIAYGSIQLTRQSVTFDLESDNSTLDGENFTIESTNLGASLGALRYFQKYYLNVELSAQKTGWTNNDSSTFAFVSMALGYKWD